MPKLRIRVCKAKDCIKSHRWIHFYFFPRTARWKDKLSAMRERRDDVQLLESLDDSIPAQIMGESGSATYTAVHEFLLIALEREGE